jgi:hypothetical protein
MTFFHFFLLLFNPLQLPSTYFFTTENTDVHGLSPHLPISPSSSSPLSIINNLHLVINRLLVYCFEDRIN